MLTHKLDNGGTIDSDVTLGAVTDNLYVGGRLVATLNGTNYSGYTVMVTGAPVEFFEDYDSAYGRLLIVAERAAAIAKAREESMYRPGVSVGIVKSPLDGHFVTMYAIEELRAIWGADWKPLDVIAVARSGILLQWPKL